MTALDLHTETRFQAIRARALAGAQAEAALAGRTDEADRCAHERAEAAVLAAAAAAVAGLPEPVTV